MPPFIQNIIFDHLPRQPANFRYTNHGDLVGYEVRKRPNFWHCLTGRRPRSNVVLFDSPRVAKPDLFQHEIRCYEEDFLTPYRYHAPPRYEHYREIIEEFDCEGCIYCLYDPSLGRRRHLPGPRPGHGHWRYDFHGHGEGYDYDYDRDGWDPAPFWDTDWMPPRWRHMRGFPGFGRGPRFHRHDHPWYSSAQCHLRRERIKLMRERLNESRHERIHGQLPRGYSLGKWRERNERLAELDETIEGLERMWASLEAGSDTDSFSFGSED